MTTINEGCNRFVFQWHITDLCNLHCSHCYQGTAITNSSSWSLINFTLQQIEEFWGNYKIHLNITGGEPFIHPDIFRLLELLHARKKYSYGILSNGTLITEEYANQIKENNVRFVQVSIEGSKEIHDEVRGKGSFEKVVEGINALKKANVDVLLSFTASRFNYKSFPSVVETGIKYKVKRVWADRVIPWGNAGKDMVLGMEETKDFMSIMAKEQKKYNGKTEIALHRALQFIFGDGPVYRCHAGRDLLTILPNGDVYPCRRLPIKMGNLQTESLMSFVKSPVWMKTFSEDKVPEGCGKCFYEKMCQGGLRCLAYALAGDIHKSDPGCWLAQNYEK